MKALAAVLLFAFCVAGAFYGYTHHIGNSGTLLGVAAAASLLLVWEAISDD